MADEQQSNLSTYKLQLQQVEASLTSDPDNEDLLKLRKDLQEVIELTNELVVKGSVTAAEEGSIETDEGADELPIHTWECGDLCMAMWSDDGQYYEATIEEILEDGSCTVTFENYGNTDVTQVSLLKSVDPNNKRTQSDDAGPDAKKIKSKKDMLAQEREKKRKKALKKAQRMKQLEEERETEKNKWLEFNAKTFSRTNKGRVKRSIFASPDNINGRVGIGTCGIGGKPMTEYHPQEKWKK